MQTSIFIPNSFFFFRLCSCSCDMHTRPNIRFIFFLIFVLYFKFYEYITRLKLYSIFKYFFLIYIRTLISKNINMFIIATKLGIPSPPPYLSLSQNDDAFLSGINYASGGAGILNETGNYFVLLFNFSTYFSSSSRFLYSFKNLIL